jgi:hypothetical protein
MGDGLVPVSPGAEDELAHLPDHRPAAGAGEHPVHPLAHLQSRIGGRKGEAAAAQDGQIEDVVADVGHLFRSGPVLGEELGEGGVLVVPPFRASRAALPRPERIPTLSPASLASFRPTPSWTWKTFHCSPSAP